MNLVQHSGLNSDLETFTLGLYLRGPTHHHCPALASYRQAESHELDMSLILHWSVVILRVLNSQCVWVKERASDIWNISCDKIG